MNIRDIRIKPLDMNEVKERVIREVHTNIPEIKRYVKKYDWSIPQTRFFIANIYITVARWYWRNYSKQKLSKESLKYAIYFYCEGPLFTYNPVTHPKHPEFLDIFGALSDIYYDSYKGKFLEILFKNSRKIAESLEGFKNEMYG